MIENDVVSFSEWSQGNLEKFQSSMLQAHENPVGVATHRLRSAVVECRLPTRMNSVMMKFVLSKMLSCLVSTFNWCCVISD
jgi:hypothetical protein